MDNNDVRRNGECHHVPCDRLGWDKLKCFLLHRSKYIDPYLDLSCCVVCGEKIRMPALYSHPLLKTGYCMIASILEYFLLCITMKKLSPLWFLFGQIVVVILVVGIVMMINSCILAYGTWQTESETSELIIRDRKESGRKSSDNYVAVFYGIFASWQQVLRPDIPMAALAASFAAIVTSAITRRWRSCLIAFAIFFALICGVLLEHLWDIPVTILNNGIVPYVLFCISIYLCFSSSSR